MGLFGNKEEAVFTHVKVNQDDPSMLRASGACQLRDSGEMVKVNIILSKTEYGKPLLKVSSEDGAEYSDPRCVDAAKRWLKDIYDGI